MTYKIIGDSCLDLTDELKKDARFQMVPLTLQVDDAQVIDDETFDQKSFLELVKNGKVRSSKNSQTLFLFLSTNRCLP